jgi:hypothetical protein
MKSSQQIYEFLTNKRNFDTTANLIESFNEVKEKLISEFWELLAQEIKKDKRLENWAVHFEPYDGDSEISIYSSGDSEKSIYYGMDIDKKKNLGYALYLNLTNSENIKKLYEEAKDFKSLGWKINSYNASGYPPFYYYIDGWCFQENETIKKILPVNREIAIREIIDIFVSDFSKEIQQFILKHLRINKIVK